MSRDAALRSHPWAFHRLARVRARCLWPDIAEHGREKRLNALTAEITAERVTIFALLEDEAAGRRVLDELGKVRSAS